MVNTSGISECLKNHLNYYLFMATLSFETLQFSKHADTIRVTFLKYYTFSLSIEKLEKIGKFSVHEHSITFPDVPEKKNVA